MRSSNGCRGKPNIGTSGCSVRPWRVAGGGRRAGGVERSRELVTPHRELLLRLGAGGGTQRPLTVRRHFVHRIVHRAAEVPHGHNRIALGRRQHQERVVEGGIARHFTSKFVRTSHFARRTDSALRTPPFALLLLHQSAPHAITNRSARESVGLRSKTSNPPASSRSRIARAAQPRGAQLVAQAAREHVADRPALVEQRAGDAGGLAKRRRPLRRERFADRGRPDPRPAPRQTSSGT